MTATTTTTCNLRTHKTHTKYHSSCCRQPQPPPPARPPHPPNRVPPDPPIQPSIHPSIHPSSFTRTPHEVAHDQ
eukprot:358826-Chlamydomonas_euryale.AAC.20